MRELYGFLKWRTVLLFSLALYLLSGIALAEINGIAELRSYSKGTMVKSLGSWGVPLQKGLPLYEGDKILTTDGSAEIRFHDGAQLAVSPNSCIRITDSRGNGETAENAREIRLFMGKAAYSSGKSDAPPTKIITPTAVAVLRGTAVTFGTNGQYAFIHHTQGESDRSGNIESVDSVPEYSPEQAAQNPVYSAAMVAIKFWLIYAEAKENLEAARFGVEENAYARLSRTDRIVPLVLAEELVRTIKYARNEYFNLVGQLVRYAQNSAQSDIAENEALLNHPDPQVAARASNAIRQLQQGLEMIREMWRRTEELKTQIELLTEKFEEAEDQEARQALSRLIEAAFEYNWASEKMGLIRMLIGEAHTIGLPEWETELDELLDIGREVTIAARDAYFKTRNYSNAVLAAIGNDPDAADLYLKLTNLTADMVGANTGVITLVVNVLEMILSGADKETINYVFNEMWKAVEARDRFVGILNEAEAKSREARSIEVDEGVVAQILRDVESSASVFRFFLDTFIRYSMVLSPPVLEMGIEFPILFRTWPLGEEKLRPPEVIKDRDGDGWPASRDCAENNPAFHPGQERICDDGKDNDCDGLIDCEDPTACRTSPACCLHHEICGDGIDNNCNGQIDEGCMYAQ